jgi:hypothetical protein
MSISYGGKKLKGIVRISLKLTYKTQTTVRLSCCAMMESTTEYARIARYWRTKAGGDFQQESRLYSKRKYLVGIRRISRIRPCIFVER